MVNDGMTLPVIATMDNGACVELIRGAQLSERVQRKPGTVGCLEQGLFVVQVWQGGEQRDDDLLQELNSRFGVHNSYVASASGSAMDRTLFGITHCVGQAPYDVEQFVEKDANLLDSSFVTQDRKSVV